MVSWTRQSRNSRSRALKVRCQQQQGRRCCLQSEIEVQGEPPQKDVQTSKSNVKGYATCKQGRSCDRRGRSAACNSSVLPYQASSATVQCRFKIRFWRRDLIFTSRGASGGKVQSSSGSKNTRTCEPAVKAPVISSTLHTSHFTGH